MGILLDETKQYAHTVKQPESINLFKRAVVVSTIIYSFRQVIPIHQTGGEWYSSGMSKYSEKDFRKISWGEYGELMEKVAEEVKDYINREDIKFDAIVPILRGGATLANYLSYKLNVLRILPVQYKYFFVDKGKAELRQILFTPQKEMFENTPTFLLVEGDQCFGNTVINAAKDLKEVFPDCKIVRVADVADYSYKDAAKDYVDKMFAGRYTNHCEELTEGECKKLNIEGATISPWENFEEEIATMEQREHNYVDGEAVKKQSKFKQEFKF
jgi:hypoxanthine phosphoribosyltransferase